METALIQTNYLLLLAAFCILAGIALFLHTVVRHSHETSDEKPRHELHDNARHEDAHERHDVTDEDELSHHYKRIINNAHNEARAILDTTSVASMNILAESKATNEHVVESLDLILQKMAQAHIEEMKKTSEGFTKSYDEKLAGLQQELKNHIELAIKESEDRMNTSLEKYLEPLATSATHSHEVIDQRTQELTDQVEKEIADYKAARIAKIEADVENLVKKTYREVLRKSIPEDMQHELVMESLENMHKEGKFAI